MNRLHFPGDWRPLANALEKVYEFLGLQKEDNGICDHDWNLGVRLFHEFKEQQTANQTCMGLNCKTPLTYHTVIRCLDCRMALCEYCAKAHFGPQHGERARAAHPDTPK